MATNSPRRSRPARPPTGASEYIAEAKTAFNTGKWDAEFLQIMQERLDEEGKAAAQSIYRRPRPPQGRQPQRPLAPVEGTGSPRSKPLSMLTKRYLNSVGRLPSKHMEGRLNRRVKDDRRKRLEEYEERFGRAPPKRMTKEGEATTFTQFGTRALEQSVMERRSQDISHLGDFRTSENLFRLMHTVQILNPDTEASHAASPSGRSQPRHHPTSDEEGRRSALETLASTPVPGEELYDISVPPSEADGELEGEMDPPSGQTQRQQSRRPSARSATSIPPTLIPKQFHIVEPAPLERAGQNDTHEMHYNHEKQVWTKTVFPSLLPSSRHEVVLLRQWASNALSRISEEDIDDVDENDAEQVRLHKKAQICHITVNELIRQVTVQCWERGALLSEVWNAALEIFEGVAPSTAMREENADQKKRIRELEERLEICDTQNSRLREQLAEMKERGLGLAGGGTLSDLSTLPDRIALRYESMESELYTQERRANAFLVQVATKEQHIKKLKSLLETTEKVKHDWETYNAKKNAQLRALEDLEETESEAEEEQVPMTESASLEALNRITTASEDDGGDDGTRSGGHARGIVLDDTGMELDLTPPEPIEDAIARFEKSTASLPMIWEHVMHVEERNKALSDRLAVLVGERDEKGIQTDDWKPLLMPKATQTIMVGAAPEVKKRRRKIDKAMSKASLLKRTGSSARSVTKKPSEDDSEKS